ncbi:MAG: hypothetical protein AAB319_10160, partial [Pseudomonadota bacterium]
MKKPIIPGAGCDAALQQGADMGAKSDSMVRAKLHGMRWVLPALTGFFVTPLFAANSAVTQAATHTIMLADIEAVQMPAWRLREGRAQPLAVGMEVKHGDRIRTGATARVYLKLAEGSSVKLGESAELGFYSRSLKPASNFKGALDVVKGAFRLTTGVLQKARGQREIAIRIGTATAAPVANSGGADLWGKSDAERDLILLIEGRIEIKHAGQTMEMAEPLSYFAAPKKTAPPEVASVDPEQFKLWVRETEILPGDGAARRNGQWR